MISFRLALKRRSSGRISPRSGIVSNIEGSRIKVDPYDSEPDYGADMLQTFEKFKQGKVTEYRFDFPSAPDMNHVEEAVLDLVAQLYPGIFSTLGKYCGRHSGYRDCIIAAFDREVQFYVACIEHIERQVMQQIVQRDMLCVSVTFLDELASPTDKLRSQ